MPKYRHAHWTDGDGIGKKIVNKKTKGLARRDDDGQDLTRELTRLEAIICEAHTKAKQQEVEIRKHSANFLQYVKEAGDALWQVHRRLGGRTKWSRWRKTHLIDKHIMSKNTTNDYMKVARNWPDKAIQEGMKRGEIRSIAAFKRALIGSAVPSEPGDYQLALKAARFVLGKRLKELSAEELKLIASELDDDMLLDPSDAMGKAWKKLIQELQHGGIVTGKLAEFDVDGEPLHVSPEEQQYRQKLNKKISDFLNRKTRKPATRKRSK